MSSKDGRWFIELEVRGRNGKIIVQPEGPVCLTCGLTCKSWPQELVETLVRWYADPAKKKFKKEFDQTRVYFVDFVVQKFPKEQVNIIHNNLLEVYLKLVFVTTKVFTTQWQEPKSLKVGVVNLFGLQHKPLEGVLFQKCGFPMNQIPHYGVKISAAHEYCRNLTILDASDIKRLSQGKELFQKRVDDESKKRGKSALAPAEACTFNDVKTKFDSVEEDRKKTEA